MPVRRTDQALLELIARANRKLIVVSFAVYKMREVAGALIAQRVLDLLGEVRARRGMTVIVVSYDPQVGARADRMVTVTDGVLTLPATDLSAASCA